jgi:heavy metal translocating P-type ATPase
MLRFLFIGAGIIYCLVREKQAEKADKESKEGFNFAADVSGRPGQLVTQPQSGVAAPTRLEVARSRLIGASGSLALGIIGQLVCKPLLWFVTGDVITKARFLFVEAWRGLRDHGRIRAVTIDSLFLIFSLVRGWYLGNVVLYWFYRLFGYLALKTEDHSRKQLVDVFAQQARLVWVEVNGVEAEVPFESLRQGDIIVASPGELVPVDGEIVGGVASVDQHLFTGEAQLVEKGAGDTVFASTIVISGRIRIRSLRTGADTLAAQIGAALNENNSYASTVEARGVQIADQASLPTLAISAVALLTRGRGAALAVMTCDFGASMRVFGPVSVLKHLEAASRHGLYVKDGRSLELLRDVDMLVFDKTGTLTDVRPEFAGAVAWSAHGEDQILAWAAAAEQRLTHPIALSIVEAARQRGLVVPEIADGHYEVGFGVRVRLPAGLVRVGSLRFMDLEGLAVPAAGRTYELDRHDIGHSVVFVALDDAVVGAIEVQPRLRDGAREIVQALRAYCPSICVISGDRDVPTRRLAETLGIDQYFAEVLPHRKAEIVERLQAEGRRICFVGDGINDSIALQKAAVSVSFQDASRIAVDCAQVVMLKSDLGSLITLFELSRSLDRSMRNCHRIGLGATAVGLGGTFFFGMGLVGGSVVANVARVAGLAYARREPELEIHPVHGRPTGTAAAATRAAGNEGGSPAAPLRSIGAPT